MLASPGVGIAGVVTNLHKPWFRVYTRQRGLQGAPTPTVEGCNTSRTELVLTVRSVGNNCSQPTSVSRAGAERSGVESFPPWSTAGYRNDYL